MTLLNKMFDKNLISFNIVKYAAMEIRKKYDSNFILTFAIAKVRYDSIMTAKNFGKHLFLVVYQ